MSMRVGGPWSPHVQTHTLPPNHFSSYFANSQLASFFNTQWSSSHNAAHALTHSPLEERVFSDCGLTSIEVTKLRLYLSTPNKFNELIRSEAPVHVRKTDENGLPRSFVYVPGVRGGMGRLFVLLKSHGVDELGEGGFKRATKLLGFYVSDTGAFVGPQIKEKAFVSARAEDAEYEVELMKLLKDAPHCLTDGIAVKYRGNVNRPAVGDLKNVPKIGVIVDLMENGDLFRVCHQNPLTRQWQFDDKAFGLRLKILADAAEGLVELHRKNIIHLDMKQENIFVDEQMRGKIADFGLASPIGVPRDAHVLQCPPEIHMNRSMGALYNSKVDVFSFGLALMASLGHRQYFNEYLDAVKSCYNENRLKDLGKEAETIFARFKKANSGPYAELIYDCVKAKQEERPSSSAVAERMRNLKDAHDLKEALNAAGIDMSRAGAALPASIREGLGRLKTHAPAAFECLVQKCGNGAKSNNFRFADIAVLNDWGVLNADGTVSSIVKKVLSSAMQDDDSFDFPKAAAQEVNVEENLSKLHLLVAESQDEDTKVSSPSVPSVPVAASQSATSSESSPVSQDPVQLVEEQDQEVRGLIAELKRDMASREKNEEKVDWRKVTEKIALSIVNAAAEFIRNKEEMRKVSSDVKAFLDGYEREKRKLEQPIPAQDEALLQEDMLAYFRTVITPSLVKKKVTDLQEVGNKLSRARQDLAAAKADLEREQAQHYKNLNMIEFKEKKYKRALANALKSAKRASQRSGIISSILNAAGSVMMAIPVVQVAGAALIAANNLATAAVDHNRNEIQDKRVAKSKGKLQDILAQREDGHKRLTAIDQRLQQIEETDRSLVTWIRSEESVGEILAKDRIALLKDICKQNAAGCTGAKAEIAAKQVEFNALQKTWVEKEAELDTYRSAPGGGAKADLGKKQKKRYYSLFEAQKNRMEPLAKAQRELAALFEVSATKDAQKKESDKSLKLAEERQTAREWIDGISPQFLNANERKIVELETRLKANDFSADARNGVQAQLEDLRKLALHQSDLTEGLNLFNQQLATKEAPFVHLGMAAHGLAREMDRLVGSHLFGNSVQLLQRAHEFKMTMGQLQNAQMGWEKFVEGLAKGGLSGSSYGGTSNLLFGVGVPILRTFSAALGGAACVVAIASEIHARYRSYGVKERTQLEQIQEMLEKGFRGYTEWLHQEMSREFVHLGKILEGNQRELLNEIAQLRDEGGTIGKEVIAAVEKGREESALRVYQAKAAEQKERVAALNKEGAQMRLTLVSKANVLQFLQWVRKEVKGAKNDTRNGYLEANQTAVDSLRGYQRMVDPRFLFQHPEHFTGLIAREVASLEDVHNLALLMELGSEFLKGYRQILASRPELINDPDVKLQIAKIVTALHEGAERLLSLDEEIGTLLEQLIKKQIQLQGDVNKNVARTRAKRNALKPELLKAAGKCFTKLTAEDLVGSKRFYLWNNIVSQPLEEWLPSINYDALSWQTTTKKAHQAGMFSFLNSQMAYTLRDAVVVTFLLGGPVYGTLGLAALLFRVTGVLDQAPAGTLIEEEAKKSLLTLDQKDVAIREPLAARPMGIELKERKIVQVSENTRALPLMSLELDFKRNYFAQNEETVGVAFPEGTVIRKGEIERIPPSFRFAGFLTSIERVMDDYQKFLEGEEAPRFAALGGRSEVLVSNDPVSQIRLAFPKELLNALQKKLAHEISHLERTGLGSLVPYYEFSSEEGTLKIGYRFLSNEGAVAAPFCKFTVAKFDPVTLRSFIKDLAKENGAIELQLKAPSEFLVQAIYSSSCGRADERLTMPSDQTVALESGLVAPSDLPFIGCFKIWEKDPSLMVDFDCMRYSEEAMSASFAYFEEGAGEAPGAICRTMDDPEFSPEYFKLMKQIRVAREEMAKDSAYGSKYSLLMALIKLHSSLDNRSLQQHLVGNFALYPPDQRATFLDRYDLLQTDGIDDFVEELRAHPSYEMAAIRKLAKDLPEI